MANATLDTITGLPSSNTQDPKTGVVTSNPLTPESMTTPAAIQTVTPTPDTTNYTGITAGATQSVIDSYNELNKKYTTAGSDLTKTGEDIIAGMTALKGKSADQAAANESAGVNVATEEQNKYLTQLADLNGQASSLNREAQGIPLIVQENNKGTGATDAGVAPQTAGALRLNALRALSIAQQSDIASAALTGSTLKLKAAQDKADQMIKLKYDPLEADLAIRTKQYELNKDTLSLIDKARTEALGVALEKEKTDLANQKATEQLVSNVQLEAAKNGANPDILAKIQGAKSVGEAISAAGSSLAAPNTEVVKVGDGAVLIDKKTGKIIKSYGAPQGGDTIPTTATPTTSALVSVGGLISGFPSVTAQKAFNAGISKLAQTPGNEKAIAEKIIGTSIDNISDSNQRKLVAGDFALSQQVTRLQGLLDDYVAGGGQTGWIKGKKEGGYQFTGNTSDPALATIGVQIANQLDELARTRTGAVVSPSEEAAFNKLLPGTGKSPELNTALTNGLKTSLMSNVEGALRYTVTSDGLNVVKSALPDVFGDYRSSNPTVQLKTIYNSSPLNKTTIDKIRKEHPEYTATEIMQIFNGQ